MRRTRARLLALATITGGAWVLAEPAAATVSPEPKFCCKQEVPWGLDSWCCGPRGCRITADACTSW
jgi:hypothetical protein